jgi:hypothetical protein
MPNYVIKSYADSLIRKPRIGYLVDRFIQQGSINIFYSYPGCLKSNLIMDMGFAIATGQPWLPSMPPDCSVSGRNTVQAPVIFIDIDNGEDVTEERMRAFGKSYNADASTPFFYMPYPDIRAINSKYMIDLTQFIAQTGLTRPFIVLDTLLRAARVKDENSSEMDTVMYNIRKLAEDLKATLALISHSNKANNGRAGNALRGHSSIEGGVDSVFRVSREGNSDTIEVTNEKSRRKPVEAFAARWTYDADPISDELTQARFYRTLAIKVNRQQTTLNALMASIRDLLVTEGKMNKSEIYARIKGNKGNFDQAVAQAVKDGHIIETPGLFNNGWVYDAK